MKNDKYRGKLFMIKFKDKKTGQIKFPKRVFQKADKNLYYVQFPNNDKIYSFNKKNVEFLSGEEEIEYLEKKDRRINQEVNSDIREIRDGDILVYAIERECYKCHKMTEVMTYIVYADTYENLLYPWDLKRLNEEKTVGLATLHMAYKPVEFYPIGVLGANERLDQKLMRAFPDRIENRWSKTQGRNYAMNLCTHCGSQQGEIPIYQEINKKIKNQEPLKIIKNIRAKSIKG